MIVAHQKDKYMHTHSFALSLLEEKVLYRTLKGSKALRIWNP